MKHYHLASLWLSTPLAKVALVLLGTLATVCFLPFAAIATLTLAGTAFSSSPTELMNVATLLLGPSGLLGLVGAWLRVLLPSERFEISRKLRRTTIGLLASGIITSTTLIAVYANAQVWVLVGIFALVLMIGLFLLAATCGIESNATTT